MRRDAKVIDINRIKGERRFVIRYEEDGNESAIEADVVVVAMGLKSLQQPVMQKFIKDFGYRPPRLMDACVTEVNTLKAKVYSLTEKMLVVDGIIPNCIVAFVPKGKGWLTITGLGKILADHDLELLFNQPQVKRYIELEHIVDQLRCRKICSASVVTKPAGKFFGDGWVMIGDLTGFGRALKDGYFAALQNADLAAQTILINGFTEAAFRRYYYKPVRKLAFDNWVGMNLFRLNQRTAKGFIGNMIMKSALREMREEEHGGFTTAALRALLSGELSYKIIFALFVAGIGAHILNGDLLKRAGSSRGHGLRRQFVFLLQSAATQASSPDQH